MKCRTVVKRVEDAERCLVINRYKGRPKGLVREEIFFREAEFHVGEKPKHSTASVSEIGYVLSVYFGCLPGDFADDLYWLKGLKD